MIAGRFKLDQLLIEPFHSLYSALISDVYEADAVLIGGYGFGDTHVNRALHSRFDQDSSRTRVIVATYRRRFDREQML